MLPTLQDILDTLEELAPSNAAEDWDNPGLQVGELSQKIKKIFISLDPTLKAVKEASDSKAQLLLTHHPLIFKSISHLNQGVYPGNVIFTALKKGISIISAHTNLDVAEGGINDILTNLFNLQDVEVLKKREALDIKGAGLGRIGYLPKPMRLSTMTETVKAVLGTERVKVVGHRNMKIRRVAVVGGSGGEMVSIASNKRADLLITGDVSHHEALEAENLGMALIDGGHFYTEKAALRPFMDRLKAALTKQDWDVTVDLYDNETCPMRFE